MPKGRSTFLLTPGRYVILGAIDDPDHGLIGRQFVIESPLAVICQFLGTSGRWVFSPDLTRLIEPDAVLYRWYRVRKRKRQITCRCGAKQYPHRYDHRICRGES